jgi:hypothetical protein
VARSGLDRGTAARATVFGVRWRGGGRNADWRAIDEVVHRDDGHLLHSPATCDDDEDDLRNAVAREQRTCARLTRSESPRMKARTGFFFMRNLLRATLNTPSRPSGERGTSAILASFGLLIMVVHPPRTTLAYSAGYTGEHLAVRRARYPNPAPHR